MERVLLLAQVRSIGSEKISLQSSTAIKGNGTSRLGVVGAYFNLVNSSVQFWDSGNDKP